MVVFKQGLCLAWGALLLSSCSPNSTTMFEVPYTGVLVTPPDLAAAHFATAAEVELRSGEESERVVAVLPPGTPVVPIGTVGSETESWRVDTPAGVGWLYTRYIQARNDTGE